MARLYDYDMGLNAPAGDVAFYVEAAVRAAGPVLELGCGTGRIALPMAEAGCSVLGIDVSLPMLQQMSRKVPHRLSLRQRSRLRWVCMDMRQLAVGQRFALVICPYSAFTYLLTRADRAKVLSDVRGLLTADGVFILDVFVPRREILRDRDDRIYFDYRRELPGGVVLERHKTIQKNKSARLSCIRRYYTLSARDGSLVEKFSTQEDIHYFFEPELRRLLERHGFEILAEYGGFGRQTYRRKAQTMVFVCRAANRPPSERDPLFGGFSLDAPIRLGNMTFLPLANAIEDWLLTSNVQQPSGPHRGGVAGWLNGTLAPPFLYPEITGYYLSWLAFAFARGSIARNDGADRAHRALRWLCRRIRCGNRLPTRVYLELPSEDWRNEVCFAFDWAMVVRGAAAARDLLEVPEIDTLISAGLGFLESCCAEGDDLRPGLSNNGQSNLALPARWSVRPGPYLLKIAAALQLACGEALPGALDRSCHKLVSVWSARLGEKPFLPDLHSFFYSLEGLVLLGLGQPDRCYWRLAAEYLALVLQNGLQGPCWHRSDVLAQALRIGSILISHGCLKGSGWRDRLGEVASALRSFTSAEGGVAFDRASDGDRPHWNAWSAMFACQAFLFWDACLSGKCVDDRLIRLLV